MDYNPKIRLELYVKTFGGKHHFATFWHDINYPLPNVGDKLYLTVDSQTYYSNVVDRVFTYQDYTGLRAVALRLENLAIIDMHPTLSEAEKAMAQELAREIAERKEHGKLESNS